jgi:uracil phosphoribosyltransferase
MAAVPLVTVDHPLLGQALSRMRDRDLPNEQFKVECHRAGLVLLAEATREIDRPAAEVLLVPVLRAGLGFHGAALELLPGAGTWEAGLWRDEETLEPHWYDDDVPGDLDGRLVLLLDPMLATGGTAAAAITRLRQAGAGPVVAVCLICVDRALKRLESVAPCRVFAAAKDPGLDERGYIVPGLGDAGDRLFGPRQPATGPG